LYSTVYRHHHKDFFSPDKAAFAELLGGFGRLTGFLIRFSNPAKADWGACLAVECESLPMHASKVAGREAVAVGSRCILETIV
jgi:hypothetical protein